MLLMRETLHKQPSFAHFLGNYSIILLLIKADMGITRVQLQFLDELYTFDHVIVNLVCLQG